MSSRYPLSTWRSRFVLIAVASTIALCCLSCRATRTVWKCPRGHTIQYIGNSGRADHVLALTRKGNAWCLYDVSANGNAVLVGSGPGRPQVLVPLSGVDFRRDKVLVGIAKNRQLSSMRLIACSISSRRCAEVPGLSSAFTLSLRQPFSPDGERMAVYGREEKMVGVWLYEEEAGTKHLLQRQGDT